MSAPHFIVRCRHCDAVMSQCRCPGPKVVRYSECDQCQPESAQEEE